MNWDKYVLWYFKGVSVPQYGKEQHSTTQQASELTKGFETMHRVQQRLTMDWYGHYNIESELRSCVLGRLVSLSSLLHHPLSPISIPFLWQGRAESAGSMVWQNRIGVRRINIIHSTNNHILKCKGLENDLRVCPYDIGHLPSPAHNINHPVI